MSYEFKEGDKVRLNLNGSDNSEYYRIGEHGDTAIVRYQSGGAVLVTYPDGKQTNWKIRDTELLRDDPQTVDSVPTKENPNAGKFYLKISLVQYFETKEQRDHYVKEHVDALNFDEKLELLNKGKFKEENLEDGEAGIAEIGEEK